MKNIAKFSTKLIKCINDKFLIHGSWIKMVYKYWKASAGNILPAHFSTGKKQQNFRQISCGNGIFAGYSNAELYSIDLDLFP